MVQTLSKYKNRYYGPKDQLLLFFSMHGVHDKDGEEGYLIPGDGRKKDDTYESWYSHSQLRTMAKSIPCNRVLVAIGRRPNGKLIGAVSYSLGQFSKEPIAGITPIAEMVDATGAAAVVLAADLQDPPETIPALVAEWRKGAATVWAVRGERVPRRGLALGVQRDQLRRDLPNRPARFGFRVRPVAAAITE